MKFPIHRLLMSVSLMSLLLALACAKKEMVSEDTQRRSQKMLGQQEQGLSSMNQTPAEQAAARHQVSAGPADEPEEHEEHEPQ